MVQSEIEDGTEPYTSFINLVKQSLNRDDGWKAFYIEKMDNVKPVGANESLLRAYEAELEAELLYSAGDYTSASEKLQDLLNNGTVDREDKAWYLQEMARYNYLSNRTEFQRLQIAAHKGNHLLLKPSLGVSITKLSIVSQGRVERIATWISDFKDYTQLNVSLSDILGNLVFGTKAEKMERALNELSLALGFAGERPDKEWKEGPDNLWALDNSNYIVWECKGEVSLTRKEIDKREAEQMNRSSAWFEKNYHGLKAKRVIIHPSSYVSSAAAFTHDVEVMRVNELKRLVKATREFFKSFELQNFKDLSTSHIQKMLNLHKLSVSNLLSDYTKKLRIIKR